jgi:hypothetical protein
VISIIKQIQAIITSEAKWLRWVWRKCKRKAKIYNIQDKAPTSPWTKAYGWQTPISKLKRVASKTEGFSMQKIILPLNPRQVKPSVKLNQRRQLPLKMRIQGFIKWV